MSNKSAHNISSLAAGRYLSWKKGNPKNFTFFPLFYFLSFGLAKTDGEYVEIIDRKEAIKYAIANGRPGDVIVLAGKGHEDYQEIKGVKYPMDERVLIEEVLQELGWK